MLHSFRSCHFPACWRASPARYKWPTTVMSHKRGGDQTSAETKTTLDVTSSCDVDIWTPKNCTRDGTSNTSNFPRLGDFECYSASEQKFSSPRSTEFSLIGYSRAHSVVSTSLLIGTSSQQQDLGTVWPQKRLHCDYKTRHITRSTTISFSEWKFPSRKRSTPQEETIA